jgi:OmpA-OmpF porin, OOP family
MKRFVIYGLVAAAGAASGGAYAAEPYDDTGAWYLSALGQYTFLDSNRVSNDHAGYQIGLGYDIAQHFAAEVNVSNGSFRIPGTGASEKLNAISIDGLFKFLPVSSMFHPYLLAGGGGMSDNIGGHNPNTQAWLAEAGGGLLYGLGDQSGSVRFQLRTEAKYRYEFIQNQPLIPHNPGDVVLGVGFQMMFGAPTPPPPPVVQAPPPPPEPTPPPPPPPPPAPECHPPAGFQMDANCHIIEQKVIVRAVDFEFNSARLTLPAQQTLDDIDHALLNQPELQIEIQGYTDSVGADSYNLNLSQKRAESVKDYLVSKGVSASVLTAKGYGKADPIASNKTAEGRAQNRRVAFSVTNAPAHLKVVTEDASDASTEAAKQGEPARAKKKENQKDNQ